MIKIIFESEIPIYLQLKNEIIKAIARGELTEGESLPSIRELSNDIGVNLHTVNKSYNLLKDEGYLIIDRRKGAIVNETNKNKDDFKSFIDEELEVFISKYICNGFTEKEVIEIIKNKYNKIKG